MYGRLKQFLIEASFFIGAGTLDLFSSIAGFLLKSVVAFLRYLKVSQSVNLMYTALPFVVETPLMLN